MMEMFDFSTGITERFVVDYGLRMLGAVITLILGWACAKVASKLIARLLDRSHLEAILSSFLSNLVYMFVLTFFIVSALNKLGVQTTSIVAVIGAAGLAIGLALQGSLSNFAAGIMIIFFRHFKIGDVIAVNGISGKVVSMSIFTTTLYTATNERIMVPNQMLTSNPLTNYTGNRTRRVDIAFSVKGDVPMQQVADMVAGVMAQDARVLAKPAYSLELVGLEYTGLRYVLHFWTRQEDYDAVKIAIFTALVQTAQAKELKLRP